MSVARALLAVIALAACGKTNAYQCAASDQCVSNGMQGVCIASFCAFGDSACAGGLRYEPNAGDGLGGTCVPGVDGGSVCGAVGQACCASGSACVADTYCDGTCQSCIGDVAFGRRFGCVLKHDRTVWCSGENAQGQLGFGIAGVPSAIPMEVRDTTSNPISDATAIATGREHACAVRANGSVWCWGLNTNGELGTGAAFPMPPATLPSQPKAVQVVTASGPLTGIVDIVGGYSHTCARDGNGGVWCWGSNIQGELGDGTTTQRNVAAPVLDAPAGAPVTGALDLTAGAQTMCIHKAGAAVWCWGSNLDGEFGDGTKTSHPSPQLLATSASVGTGMWHVCYVNADTTITCAGWNGHARLGTGSGGGYWDGDHTTPSQVVGAPGGAAFNGVAKVIAGGETCAIMLDTSVYCWGDNAYGQIGTGEGENVPAKVRFADGTPLTGVDRLVAHWAHVCAHETTGTWVCWGRNTEGEFGDTTFINHGLPTPLPVTCP